MEGKTMQEDIQVEGILTHENNRIAKNGKHYQNWRTGEQSFTVFDGNESELLKNAGCNVKINLVKEGKFIRYEKGLIEIMKLPNEKETIKYEQKLAKQRMTLARRANKYRDCLQEAQHILKDFNEMRMATASDVLSVTRDLFIYEMRDEE
jgi:hypothetical protein